MAKRTIGFENYKDREFDEYTGEDPRPGTWLNATCNRAKYLPEDDQVVFYCTVVDHPDYTGWTRGVYAPMESDDNMFWKTQDMIIALTGKKAAVSIDWENDAAVATFLKRTKKFKIKVGEYNDRVNIRSTRPLLESVGATTKASTQTAKPTAVEAAPEPDTEEELEDYTEEELLAMSPEELEEILTDEFEVPEEELPELTARQAKLDKDGSKLKKLLVDAVLEAQVEGDEDEGEDPSDGDDPEFSDGFEEDPEPEPEPEPAKPARRSRAKAAAPAAEPEPAPTTRTRRTRR